jgi:hypothetical protein
MASAGARAGPQRAASFSEFCLAFPLGPGGVEPTTGRFTDVLTEEVIAQALAVLTGWLEATSFVIPAAEVRPAFTAATGITACVGT